MGAFGRDLIRHFGGDLDDYDGNKPIERKSVFKVIIAGSRNFTDYNFLRKKCDRILSNIKDEKWILSGCAKGADSLGEQYAQERGYYLAEFPANWDLHGKKAGVLRNEEMAREADALIVFIKNQSRGSLDMLRRAEQKGLKIREFDLK